MAVPTQKQLHRPFLEIVSNSEDVVTIRQVNDALSQRFALTEDDLLETISSGQSRFENRTYWAASYLRRAGLLQSPSRARFKITPEGYEFLENNEGDIEIRQLNELIEARQPQEVVGNESDISPVEIVDDRHDELDPTAVPPDEQIAALHTELNNNLADELLESVKNVPPDSFERLVVSLLEKMEYGEGQAIGRSGDGGVDGIINQDPLGLEKVYIQAKRWQNQVGEPEIRTFSGSLEAKGANKGVFITTSTFSVSARQTAQFISAGNKFIRLINGAELARLMISHGVGVVTKITYEVKQLDENYFVDL